MKLVLKRPIKVGEKAEITELVFRERVTSGDLRGIKLDALVGRVGDSTVDDYLKIAGRLCGQPEIVMNDLSEQDLGDVVDLIVSFRSGGPKSTAP